MSFERLPDGIVRYATYELAELLATLTTRQRAAIDRIVRHVYIDNLPWAHLFRGENKICPEAMYYRKGKVDANGKRSGFGWGHDPDFKAALDEAVRLALSTQERERLGLLNKAKRKAEQAAGDMVDTWIGVANHSELDFARIQAAEKVIDLAFKGSGPEQSNNAASLEADWWAAADGDN